MSADVMRDGVITEWDVSRCRGVIRGDDDPRPVTAPVEVFDEFSVTAHAGLKVRFQATATRDGLRAVRVLPRL